MCSSIGPLRIFTKQPAAPASRPWPAGYWIRHGENGFIFERQEDAWQYLERLREDRHLREHLGRNARQTAEATSALSSPPAQAYLSWLARA